VHGALTVDGPGLRGAYVQTTGQMPSQKAAPGGGFLSVTRLQVCVCTVPSLPTPQIHGFMNSAGHELLEDGGLWHG
jgi:hypothetical protein